MCKVIALEFNTPLQHDNVVKMPLITESVIKTIKFNVSLDEGKLKDLRYYAQLMELSWQIEDHFEGKVECNFIRNDGRFGRYDVRLGNSSRFILYVAKKGEKKRIEYDIALQLTGGLSFVSNNLGLPESPDKGYSGFYSESFLNNHLFPDIAKRLKLWSKDAIIGLETPFFGVFSFEKISCKIKIFD